MGASLLAVAKSIYYKKGYTRGQRDLMVLNYHKDYKGLCIEFKSPTNNYHICIRSPKTNEEEVP